MSCRVVTGFLIVCSVTLPIFYINQILSLDGYLGGSLFLSTMTNFTLMLDVAGLYYQMKIRDKQDNEDLT